MNIRFNIPKNEIIPTKLRVIIDDDQRKEIIYTPVQGRFAYDFHAVCIDDVNEVFDIVNKIVDIMCSQSYDHGAEWREVSKEVIPQKERYKSGTIVRVTFRIKDSY